VSGTPNIAIITLGVEAISQTEDEARKQAGGAINGILEVIIGSGVPDHNVQAQHFRISPRYDSIKVTECPPKFNQLRPYNTRYKSVLVG